MQRYAIYSRKSRFTGKGESIENQIELCKHYIRMHNPDIREENIMVFEDEGFSGGNVQRPQFKAMMEAGRNRAFSSIVCYRLDRISRNIGDFAKLIEELGSLHISFVSVKEQFDTSTSMGRAMMYIASVFSQLERETIAERIRDNMHELAKSGRWLGGNTPTGYKSVQVKRITMDGKTRRACKLELVEEQARVVQKIYALFLQSGSLAKVETHLLQTQVKTKRGNPFTRFAIRGILQNPVYAIADRETWEYFDQSAAEIYSDATAFDGSHGIMAYNKTAQTQGKATQMRDMEEWIVAVGKHAGCVSGRDWVKAQKLLARNKAKGIRRPKSSTALLSGLLVCGRCGSYMRPKKYNSVDGEGNRTFAYLCETKEKSRRQRCDMKNINGNALDRRVCLEIQSLGGDDAEFVRRLLQAEKSLVRDTSERNERLQALHRSRRENQKKIEGLLDRLAQAQDTAASEYMIRKINELHALGEGLQADLKAYGLQDNQETRHEIQVACIKELLQSFGKAFETLSMEDKRDALRAMIHKIVWDGECAHVYLYGAQKQRKDRRIGCEEPQGEDSK